MSAAHRLLVPTDGSDNAARALDYAIALMRAMPDGELHLLNVQPPVIGVAASLVGQHAIRDYHREEGMKVLTAPIEACRKAGVPFKHHIGVGPIGETIGRFAKELGCDQIVMGTRGLGSALGLLLGSVATDVIHHAPVPVTLVK
jgi:nucleotide-binding universal stress UspA family protein